MSATQIIMAVVGIKFEPHYAAKLAALRVRLIPDSKGFEAEPDSGKAGGAKDRARPLPPGIRADGCANEEYRNPRGQRREEHIFGAADRIEEAWKRVPSLPDTQAVWRATSAMAWVAVRAPLLVRELHTDSQIRELFAHDPRLRLAWLSIGNDPTRLNAYLAVLTGETTFWRDWWYKNPDPPNEVSIVGEVWQHVARDPKP